MLKICDVNEIEGLYPYGKDDVFFERIKSDYNLYGNDYPEYSFYCCVESERITAVFSKICGVITVSADNKADINEILEFCNILGYSGLLLENKFPISSQKSGNVMLKQCNNTTDIAVLADSEVLKEVFEIIKQCFDNVPSFQNWFPDISHKIRHGTAHLAIVNDNGKPVSCAFSLFENDESAVISSVATLKDFRNNGYAAECIHKLSEVNRDKKLYVFCENNRIEEWYNKLGFIKTKTWSELNNVR